MAELPARRRAVAVVGAGPIGRSWVRTFTRAGYETRLWDPDPGRVEDAWAWLKADLKVARKRQGLRKAVARSQRELVARCDRLEEAVGDAAYVQECLPDRLEEKQAAFARMDQAAGERTILASSSASFDVAVITADLPGRARCLLAHPLRLPHAVPAVEICAGSETDPAVIRRTVRFHARIGQVPLMVKRFVPGLVADRLEAALLREAASLVARGAADLGTVEGAVQEGLGLRWAVLGPFGLAHTGAAGGLREALAARADALRALWADLATDVDLTPAFLERLAAAMETLSGGLDVEEHRQWRDDLIERIRRLKSAHPAREVEPEE
jgi:L-gulonate 3-dehydrogenase